VNDAEDGVDMDRRQRPVGLACVTADSRAQLFDHDRVGMAWNVEWAKDEKEN
jgi:hypothetical protein